MVIAVDFDGTLCEYVFPEIGKPHETLINDLKRCRKENGDKLILLTCRCGEYLDKAVEWCKEQGLIFDAVNENVPDIILSIDECGFAWDDPMWFKAEICEDCLKKIMEEVKDGNCR